MSVGWGRNDGWSRSVDRAGTMACLGVVNGAGTMAGLGAVDGAGTMAGLGAVNGAETMAVLGAVNGVRLTTGAATGIWAAFEMAFEAKAVAMITSILQIYI